LLKHYFIVSIRNISRHKWSAVINIGGLSVGMVCCILILLFVQHELSYDKFHEKSNQIYRLVLERQGADRIKLDISSPALLAPALKNDFPRIINRHLDNSTSLKKIYLQPLNRIHFYSSQNYNLSSDGNINYTLLITAIAAQDNPIECIRYE
jgi:hypothetical protein